MPEYFLRFFSVRSPFLFLLTLRCCLILCLATNFVWAQPGYGPVASHSSGEMLEQVRKLQVLGKVLYVAAHPDDENTRMLAWLARDQQVETAYLSLTRGDGGQNLIGKEVREGLGLIRTQELLAARRIDGAMQYFTRANDFGYSKNPEETFEKWDRDSLLADVVWVIRKFQPDVIITRFNPEPSPTHGHHTASAQLALEAFSAAADPNRFPHQLLFVAPGHPSNVAVWQAKSIYWNTSWWFYGRKDFDKSGLLQIDVGSYNTVLGTGYGEIASASRSMHKSQGFGASRQRGEEPEYLKGLQGETSLTNLFAGIELSWKRVPGSQAVAKALVAAERAFDPSAPWQMLPALLEARAALSRLPVDRWKVAKLKELEALILVASGIWHECTADRFSYVVGDSAQMNFRSIVRHPVEVRFEAYALQAFKMNHPEPVDLYGYKTLGAVEQSKEWPFNQLQELEQKIRVPEHVQESTPYWLRRSSGNGFFALRDERWVGYAENPPVFQAQVQYQIKVNGAWHVVRDEVPVYFRWTDPADGEKYRPIEVHFPVYVQLDQSNYLSAGQALEMQVLVQASGDLEGAAIRLHLPPGWYPEPEAAVLGPMKGGTEQMVRFAVHPGKEAGSGQVTASVTVPGQPFAFDRSLQRITYPHLPITMHTPKAAASIVFMDVQRRKQLIGYLPGAGDDIPAALQAMGYTVEEIRPDQCQIDQLKRYETIVAGVRIANIADRLENKMPILLDYVAQGGTLIFQYNTSQSLKIASLGPYSFSLSRGRVTVEEAPVSFLAPEHPLLLHPNKITAQDFEGWVQERGLYFPSTWDSAYTALFRMHDPGEAPLDGALLYAEYGKGVYIYSGLSWFRQLPAGVPGAYRLFMNMIESEGKVE